MKAIESFGIHDAANQLTEIGLGVVVQRVFSEGKLNFEGFKMPEEKEKSAGKWMK